jgi:hypothetical protein
VVGDSTGTEPSDEPDSSAVAAEQDSTKVATARDSSATERLVETVRLREYTVEMGVFDVNGRHVGRAKKKMPQGFFLKRKRVQNW